MVLEFATHTLRLDLGVVSNPRVSIGPAGCRINRDYSEVRLSLARPERKKKNSESGPSHSLEIEVMDEKVDDGCVCGVRHQDVNFLDSTMLSFESRCVLRPDKGFKTKTVTDTVFKTVSVQNCITSTLQ